MVQYPTADALMAGPLGGWLQTQVDVRAAAKAQARKRLTGAAMILVPAFAAFFLLAPLDFDTKLWLSFFVVAGAWGWSQVPVVKATKAVKGGINEAIAHALGLTYLQDCDAGEEFALAKAFRLLPSYDRCNFEDRWEGAVDGHAFSLHEAHLEEQRQSGKTTHWVTVFRGSIMRIGFARTFHGTTLVARQGKFKRWFGGKRDSIELDGVQLDAADMVSPEFEDAFDVYTTDQVEARWIVHPSYIERLVAIEQAFKGEDIAALFTGGAVVIVLKSGNLFESGSIDPREDREKLAETIAQFQRLADLALELNTNQRIAS